MEHNKRGRPFGFTGKYKDKDGNPISVYQWRRESKEYKAKHRLEERSFELKVKLNQKIIVVLNKLSKLTGANVNQLVEKALIKYFKEVF